MDTPASDLPIFWAVVFVRFLLPLFMPRIPLPAILACLVVDAVDQSVFQAFAGSDLAWYQGYDKALDIYYLAIAMLVTLRNWTSYPAVQIARALFYLRLVGVMEFELTGWRPFLLIFPNAFEFFFIFYELVRSSWSPGRMSARFLVIAAAVIWLVFKLPQEYWIHIAQLDLTVVLKDVIMDAPADIGWGQSIARRPLAFLFLLGLGFALVAGAARLLRHFAGPPEHELALAAEPLPEFIDEAQERDLLISKWRLFDLRLLEKIWLVGLITVIFAETLPRMDASPAQLMAGAGIIVTINAFLRLRWAHGGRSLESATASFLLLALLNAAIVAVSDWILRQRARDLDASATLFFLLLLTLIVTLYDRWRPVFDARFARDDAPLARGEALR